MASTRNRSSKAGPAYITESLRPLAVAVSDLVPDPANARAHPEESIASIERSLRTYGQRKPIVVQRDGMIVRAGNGTLEAARRLGWDYLAAVVIDEGNAAATAYAIADNRTGDLSSFDDRVLAAVIADLQETDYIGELGFGQKDLETYLHKFADDLNDEGEGGLDDVNLDADGSEHTCPKCGFSF